MSALVLLLAWMADQRLTFTKSFPQSQPPYVSITVEESGLAEFRSDPKDEQPVTFQLTKDETADIFAIAAKVNLTQKLESPARVAYMGQKTFRFEKNGMAAEQAFNYTDDTGARALADWFERISESERCFLDLERAAKYEKTGVNSAILLIQASWERKRLVAPHQFLPLLDRVANGESYMRIARNRAVTLAATFRALP